MNKPAFVGSCRKCAVNPQTARGSGLNTRSSDSSDNEFSHAYFERWVGFRELNSIPTSHLSPTPAQTLDTSPQIRPPLLDSTEQSERFDCINDILQKSANDNCELKLLSSSRFAVSGAGLLVNFHRT